MLKRNLINDNIPGYRAARSFGKEVLYWKENELERAKLRSSGPLKFRNTITALPNGFYDGRPYNAFASVGSGNSSKLTISIESGVVPKGLTVQKVGNYVRVYGNIERPSDSENAQSNIFPQPVNSQSYYKKFIEGQDENPGLLYDEYYFLIKAEYRVFGPIVKNTVYSIFRILININWSDTRDIFINQIQNQVFMENGITLSNEEYLNSMKNKGYFT